MEAKERFYWIDQFRALAIFFVFMAHCSPEGHRNYFLPYFTYCFMPIFFFLSGYLHKEGRSIKQLANRVFFRLYIPFVFFCLIRALMHIIQGGSLGEYGMEFLRSALLGTSNIWFFPCIISVEILAWIIDKLLRIKLISTNGCMLGGAKIVVVILSFLSIFLINGHERCYWHANTAITMLSFFYVGNLFREHNYIDKLFRVRFRYSIVAFVCYLITCHIVYRKFGLFCNVSINQYDSVLAFIMLSVTGVLIYLLVIKQLSRCKIIEYMGQNTILLYGINLPLLTIATIITNHVFPPVIHDLIWIPAICIIAISMGLLLSIPINSYLPIVVGLKKQK